MGFTPSDIDKMTLWEFETCVDGYSIAHGLSKSKGMSDSDYDKLVSLGDKWNEEVNA